MVLFGAVYCRLARPAEKSKIEERKRKSGGSSIMVIVSTLIQNNFAVQQ